MKKLIFVAILLCFPLLFCGCQEEEPFDPFIHTEETSWAPPQTSPPVKVTIPQNVTESTASSTVAETTEKKKKKKKPTEVPTQGVENPAGHIPVTTVMGDTDSEDLIFRWNDITISLNEKIDDVFERIGEDNSSLEISDTEMSYEYKNFIIYTYIDHQEIERVCKIEPLTEKYTTIKGVSCGDYASALKKHYGNSVEETSNTKQYGSSKKRLVFTYKNNLITQIYYEFLPEES